MSAPASAIAAAAPASSDNAQPARPAYAPCASCGSPDHQTVRCRAHLHPDVIVHLLPAKKQRFRNYLLALAQQAAAAEDSSSSAAASQIDAASSADDAATTAAAASSSHPQPPLSPSPSSEHASACLGLSVVDTAKEPELLFLRTPRPLELVRFVQHSPLLQRHFQSIFVASFHAANEAELVARIKQRCDEIQAAATSAKATSTQPGDVAAASSASSAAPSVCVLRVQTHPKALRGALLDPLMAAGLLLSPQQFTHVLYAARAYGRLYGGIVGRELYFLPHSRASHIDEDVAAAEGGEGGATAADVLSRAYWKLHEAFLLDASLRALVVRPGAKAIDIGASPGGWTAFLASKGLRVLAVDPGAVHASSPLVQHVAKRMEDALTDGDVARFAAATAAATPAGEDHSQAGISLVVCDMNVRPSLSAELIRQLCESVPCPLSPDAVLVLTCKETLAGRSKMLVEEAQAELSDWWMEFRTTHLLSNGKERTLIARRRQDATEEQRKQVRQQVENDKLRKQQRREEHKAAKEAAAAAEAAGNAAAP